MPGRIGGTISINRDNWRGAAFKADHESGLETARISHATRGGSGGYKTILCIIVKYVQFDLNFAKPFLIHLFHFIKLL